ncbi:MAG: hypothetical protein WC506_01790 [Candidatus Micrarchaeia archaeon]
MALDDLLISTGVDNLIRLIHEKGKVELKAASQELSLAPETVESWAKVLEEEGIIRIEYKFTKVYLTWVSAAAPAIEQKAAALESRKSQISSDIGSRLATVRESKDDLASLRESFERVYKALDPKNGRLSAKTEELKKMESGLDNIYEKYADRISKIRASVKSVEKQLAQVESGGFSKPKIAGIINQATEDLAKAKLEFTTVSSSLDSEISSFESNVISKKVEIEEEIKSSQDTMAKINAVADRRDEIQLIIDTISDLERRRDKLESSLEALYKQASILQLQASTPQMAQAVEKRSAEIQESYRLTENEGREFDAKREELKDLIRKIWNEEA